MRRIGTRSRIAIVPRPRRFDEQHLLDAAQELFWVRGYERTTLDDVARASGVGNGSIYAAYGSKLGLFVAVLDRYCAGRVAFVEQVLAERSDDFEAAVEHYLEAIVADCVSYEDRRGCLMLNSIAEVAPHHPAVAELVQRAIARMNAAMTARVAAAVEDGAIRLPPEQLAPLGAHLVLVSQGIIHLSRVGVPPEHLRAVAASARHLSSLLAAA
jgi:AcrR family transcriptional regulator